MNRRQRRERVVEAYALRRACLRLTTESPTTEAQSTLASFPLRAWELFLTAECCALPLGRIFRERGVMQRLPREIRDALQSAEARELQRVLAARSVLRMLDEVARALAMRVVILKGGIAVGEPGWSPVDLGDVDIVVSSADGECFWKEVTRRGWRSEPSATIAYASMVAHDTFVPLRPPGSLMGVDYHRAAENTDVHSHPSSVRALGGHTSLDRPVGPHGTLAVVRHSVVDHPFRRGHLRDLFLTAQFIGELSPAERIDLESLIAGGDHAEQMREFAAQATSLADRQGVGDSTPTAHFVTWKYSFVLDGARRLYSLFPAWKTLSQVALDLPAARRARYRTEVGDAIRTSPKNPSMQTAVHRGVLPARVLWLFRIGYRVALVGMAIACGNSLRRAAAEMSSGA